jgi:MoaA/NifB/PqqE/SkfB family radical SAM enzyme
MYIAPHAKALRHADRLVDWRNGLNPAPVTVEWDVTNVCSLGCQSCHFAHTHEAGPWATKADRPQTYTSTGRFASARLIDRALGEMAPAGVKAIVWSGGGEPTLHPELGHIMRLAHDYGLEQGLYTHGGHLTPELVDTIAACLSWVVVSLDACDAETYAAEKRVPASRFHAACEGIRALSAAGVTVGVSFLLHAGNWRVMTDMHRLAQTLGATYTTFRPTIDTSPTAPGVRTGDASWVSEAIAHGPMVALSQRPDVECDVDRFTAYRDWSGHGYTACRGVTLNTTITPDGRVWICPQRRGLDGSALGDLRAESFGAIWARHPGQWAVDKSCRVMCRLHAVNLAVAPVFNTVPHEAFV